jgi:hypothetical protein
MKKRLLGILACAALSSLILTGCDALLGTAKDEIVTALALDGQVTAPVKDATPVTTAINTTQYTGNVIWYKSDDTAHTGPFAGSTVYKAVLVLTAKSGFTFTGLPANSFTHTGLTVSNPANSGTVTITFPETVAAGQDTVVNSFSLDGLVTAPVKDATPLTTAINTTQYTGTVAWYNSDNTAHTGAFAASTVYKAVLVLTAKSGFTFTGVAANRFTYSGATSVTNAAGSGTVTITFPATVANAEDSIPQPQDRGVVQIHLPQRDNRALNSFQTQELIDYYEVIFKEKDAYRYYAGTGRTGDTVTIQVSGNTTYEILILGGYEYQYRHILLGSVFANKLDGDRVTYGDGGTGIFIAGGTRTSLSFTLDPLLLDPITDYTVAFSGAGPLDTDGKPERINGILCIADTQHPLKDQADDLSITVALQKVLSLVRAEGGMRMHFAEVQGRFDVYDPAVERFIYYSLLKSEYQTLSENKVSLEFTLSAGVIQGITPADGDWRFDFEATYYGFGDSASGGSKWTIRNGLESELDRAGGIGGGLWVHFGNGNGFRGRELSS